MEWNEREGKGHQAKNDGGRKEVGKKKKKEAEVGYEETSKTKKAVERLQTLMRESREREEGKTKGTKERNETEVVVPCPQVNKELPWPNRMFCVYKCCDAFKGDSECVFVWCGPCARVAMASVDEDNNEKIDKKGRNNKRSSRRGVPVTTEYKKVGGRKTTGTCGAHTYGDVRLLGIESDANYTWRKQQKRKGGRDNIGKHCFGCGLIL